MGAWPRQRLSLGPALGTLPSIFVRSSPLLIPANAAEGFSLLGLKFDKISGLALGF